jgi:hypothetical protein
VGFELYGRQRTLGSDHDAASLDERDLRRRHALVGPLDPRR